MFTTATAAPATMASDAGRSAAGVPAAADVGGREGRMFDGGELRLVILALIAEKPRYGYEDHQGARRAGRGRLFAKPRRRLSDADHARRNGLRPGEPGPAGAQALRPDAGGRENPRRQQEPRSTPSSPASAAGTTAGAPVSSRSSGRCSIYAPRFSCACAAATRRRSRSRRSSTRSMRRPRRSSAPDARPPLSRRRGKYGLPSAAGLPISGPCASDP